MSKYIDNLIKNLCILPGVGKKSASRMAYYLLQNNREGALKLAESLHEVVTKIGRCKNCCTFSEYELCHICSNEKRYQTGMLCIVEQPSDVIHIENIGSYSGTYFILGGLISPLDGIGPQEINLNKLYDLLSRNEYKEVILALKPSQETEVTYNYIKEICSLYEIPTTMLAQGVPIGSDFDNIDSNTLQLAFNNRK